MTSHLITAEYRRLFQRAVRENTTVEEARRRNAQERWQATQSRLAERRCGTRSDGVEPSASLFWWENQ